MVYYRFPIFDFVDFPAPFFNLLDGLLPQVPDKVPSVLNRHTLPGAVADKTLAMDATFIPREGVI